jgi:hypothetical protein
MTTISTLRTQNMQHSAHSDSARQRSHEELVKAATGLYGVNTTGWTVIKVDIDDVWHMDMHNWRIANGCDSKSWAYSYTYEIMFFKHESDALSFKLRFSDVCR